MRFVHPQLLWLLLAVPLFALAGWWARARSRAALRRFAGGADYVKRFTGDVSRHRRTVKLILLYLALAAVVVTLARPQWGTRLEPITRKGIDVVVVLDTSLSMAAQDVPPSRLAHAVHEVQTLLESIAGNRVALVTFAGQATLDCPLTLDHAAVRLFLESVQVESVQVPGTALADALRLALRSFGTESSAGEDASRALVLFSDGEDHEGGVEDLLGDLERAGVAVYAIGCGSTRGAPIPLEDEAGLSTGYKKDQEGRVVTTRLEEAVLQQLALESGGSYYRATTSEVEVQQIADELTAMDAREFGSVLRARYEDRFQVPLLFALASLLGATVLGDRRKRAKREDGESEVV